ncbi:DUF1963 domain-containing protein [Plantactinospora sp. B24E8]|uniref:DUF1963 domain-containing protein n=1 Tax=Plantactinospora sp. B24E8 TaxID=3153567 RepID=UPI00325EB8CF
MDLRSALDRLRNACVARFGEPAGVRLAALARPGFDLRPATGDNTTGRCAFGGPALLDPGTPWPEYDGFPLSLLAVLDTDALADWLGEHLPRRVGLLNIFGLEPAKGVPYPPGMDFDDPRWLRVVPADPARAVPVPTPAGDAALFDRVPIRAVPLLTMPDVWGEAVQRIDFGDEHPVAVADAIEEFYTSCPELGEASGASTFGWPVGELGSVGSWQDDHTHLLKLCDGPSEIPTLYFSIPTEAFRAGDFSRAVVTQEVY